MDTIDAIRSAVQSPSALKKLWRKGTEGGSIGWSVSLRPDGKGGHTLDEPYSTLAAAANEFGESFLALDIALYGERTLRANGLRAPEAIGKALIKLGHARALAMLRMGRTEEAHALLEELSRQYGPDFEVSSALARSHKDFAFLSDQPEIKVRHLKTALELYLAAYAASKNIFPGINAAAISLWLNLREEAERIAGEVARACLSVNDSKPETYWDLVTLAEAHLILGRIDEAAESYLKARELVGISRTWANLATTRKQARRTCEHLKCDFSKFERVFDFPNMLVFSGHMFDRPDRPQPRFPESLEGYIRERLRSRLIDLNPGFAVTSAACGADFLFIEEMLDLKADVRIVLPWPKEDFIRSSVQLKEGANWVERFNSLLERVSSVTYLSQQTEPKKSMIGYEYLNQTIGGLALIGAQALGTEVIPVAVWDMKAGDGLGGTSSFVSFWRDRGHSCEIIELPSLGPSERTSISNTTPTGAAGEYFSVARGQETIKTMLFADVSGYTKVPPQSIELFVNEFLRRISTLMDNVPAADRPILSNTWGDAIYLVFDEVISGGNFAVKLRNFVEKTDWLPVVGTNLRLRISLHTGPVLLCVDPITRRMAITGSHVSHTARIEPVVNPGEVWASEGFAAQSAIASYKCAQTPEYRLDYLGQKELSKKYGSYSLFRLGEHRVKT